jgi:DNA gyrase inhibitor GyrI
MADTPAEAPKRRRTTKPAGESKPAAKRAAASKPARKPAAKSEASTPAATAEAKPARRPRTAAKPAAAKAAPRPKAAARKPATPKAAAPKAAAPASAPAERKAAPALVERARDALPEVPPRAGLFAAIGALATVGGAFFIWRASRAEEPNYQTVESDGPIEIRKYPALVTAGTEHRGQRKDALNEGFRVLADYIFAKSRPGKKIPMTAPVLSDTDKDGSWRTRFVMPVGQARGELPQAPSGVELVSEPAARVAAIRFSGRADDATLDAKEGALRSWLQLRGLPNEGKAVHAYYNAPFLPGPFRRNEVLIELSSEGG